MKNMTNAELKRLTHREMKGGESQSRSHNNCQLSTVNCQLSVDCQLSLSLPSGIVPKGTKVEVVNPEYMEVHYFLDGDSNDIKLHNGEPFIINGDIKITLFGRVSMKLTDFVEFDFKVEKGQENE